MTQKIKPARWLLEYVAALPLIGLPLWYIVGHLFLHVPSPKLIVPLAYLSGLHLAFGRRSQLTDKRLLHRGDLHHKSLGSARLFPALKHLTSHAGLDLYYTGG